MLAIAGPAASQASQLECVRTIEASIESIAAVAVHGTRVASIGERGDIKVFDVETGEPRLRVTIPDPHGVGNDLAFSPDGRLLAAIGGTIAVWNCGDGSLLTARQSAFGSPIAWAADSSRVAWYAGDWSIHVLDLDADGIGATHRVRFRPRNDGDAIALSPDGAELAIESRGSVAIRDVQSGATLRTDQAPDGDGPLHWIGPDGPRRAPTGSPLAVEHDGARFELRPGETAIDVLRDDQELHRIEPRHRALIDAAGLSGDGRFAVVDVRTRRRSSTRLAFRLADGAEVPTTGMPADGFLLPNRYRPELALLRAGERHVHVEFWLLFADREPRLVQRIDLPLSPGGRPGPALGHRIAPRASRDGRIVTLGQHVFDIAARTRIDLGHAFLHATEPLPSPAGYVGFTVLNGSGGSIGSLLGFDDDGAERFRTNFPDAARAGTISADGTVAWLAFRDALRSFDATTGRELASLSHRWQHLEHVDGDLHLAGEDDSLLLWDAARDVIEARLPMVHRSPSTRIAADGRTALAVTFDRLHVLRIGR